MNNLITIDPIKTDQIEAISIDCKKILQNSEGLAISTQNDLDNANIVLKIVKGKLKELEESRKAITNPLLLAKRKVDELYKISIEMLAKAESLIKRGMIIFTEKVEAERRKQEEELRKKLEKKAERAEVKGNIEKADELRQQAELTTVASAIQKPTGISYSERWFAVVTDEQKVPREYMIPDQSKLDSVARATRGSISIEGVIFKSEKVIKSRA